MENEKSFQTYIKDDFLAKSTTEKESLALAIGFHPHLNINFKLKNLKNAMKSQDLILRRAAVAALGFSTFQDIKGGKKQKKILTQSLKDPLATIRITASIALGINALYSSNRKFQRKSFNEFRKKLKKEDFIVKQGYTVGIGLLSKIHTDMKDNSLSLVLDAFHSSKMENPSVYLVGLTLTAINTNQAEKGLDFITETIIPNLTSKESRRIAVICTSFLFPLIPDPNTRVEKLEKMITQKIEFHSKFGTDSAIMLTYFSLQDDKKQQENFLIRLLGLKDLDPDYDQIFNILKEKKGIIEILRALMQSTKVDIKAAGIIGSFFLELVKFQQPDVNLYSFIEESLQQRASGYVDRFLVLLRSFSYCLMHEEYDLSHHFESFFHSNDQRIKRFAGIAYACLRSKSSNDSQPGTENIFSRIATEQDENVKWGLLIGCALTDIMGKNVLDDELILGLLLLSLGFIEASTSLLISQAMISKFYE